jgi:hypothetical protein
MCGQHGASFAGIFLCGKHWQENKRANEALEAQAATERERERQTREEEARCDRAAQLPGFPTDGPALGLTIAQALESLVPEHKRQFVIERGRWSRVSKSVDGWVFYLRTSKHENSRGWYDQSYGMLVDTKGGVSSISWLGANPRVPDDFSGAGNHFYLSFYGDNVADSDLGSIRSQVNEWRGIGRQGWPDAN